MLEPERMMVPEPTLVSAAADAPLLMIPESVKLFDPPTDALEPKVMPPDAVAAVVLLLIIAPPVERPVPLIVNVFEIDWALRSSTALVADTVTDPVPNGPVAGGPVIPLEPAFSVPDETVVPPE